MSSSIWTQCAGGSRLRRLRLSPWRVVEAQHQISTRKLVDSIDEQAILEQLIETSKPVDTTGGRRHVLLATPFRYPPLRHGSRFGARHDPGLWYGSADQRTLFAEAAYYRLLFLEGTSADLGIVTTWHTAFTVSAKTERGIDLTARPFDAHRAAISSPSDYRESQALGQSMRDAGVGMFRWRSARDAEGGINVGIFLPAPATHQCQPRWTGRFARSASASHTRLAGSCSRTGRQRMSPSSSASRPRPRRRGRRGAGCASTRRRLHLRRLRAGEHRRFAERRGGEHHRDYHSAWRGHDFEAGSTRPSRPPLDRTWRSRRTSAWTPCPARLSHPPRPSPTDAQYLPRHPVVDFFTGRRYGDIIYENAALDVTAGCTVTDLILQLFDNQGSIVASQRSGEPPAVWGGTGAYITSWAMDGTGLEARVRSWRDFRVGLALPPRLHDQWSVWPAEFRVPRGWTERRLK